MANTKSQNILRLVVKIGLVTIGVAILSYVLLFRPLQIRNQKADFDKAEVSLDELATKIENIIGKPDESKKVKSCGYSSQEFGRGPRSCGVTLYSIYKNRDFQNSNNLMRNASVVVGTKIYESLGRETSSFTEYSGRGPSQSFEQEVKLDQINLNCKIVYSFPVVPLFDKEFKLDDRDNLKISLSCSEPAMKEFYPVNKN